MKPSNFKKPEESLDAALDWLSDACGNHVGATHDFRLYIVRSTIVGMLPEGNARN